MNNPELIRVFFETKNDLERGYFVNPEGDKVKLKKRSMIRGTKVYSELEKITNLPYFENPKIYVQNIDTFEKAIEMGPDAACLNMASARNRGGGVERGSMAQEESLCRRSNLILSLESVDYPIPFLGGIYSPKVSIYKNTRHEEMEKVYLTNVISVSALNRPALVEDDQRINPSCIWIVKAKIRAILRIAILNGHTKLVLGAFGCGAYRNPAGHVAELFYKILNEPEFKNSFEEICFAIIEDLNSKRLNNKQGNLIPFINKFGQKQ